ncbi:PadR family transcriptional regulator [Paenibacillus donghaensis]|uniref:PadR family transcriptional regulator n=1 Tax=Paenibacillus donghaensis TaxID=414771 RepID=A0A2Z2KM84_9BACL|nr:PadR family transcriptional regulator [Paenibacillus donghaensis]ASA23629.1 PadR family transcriptional regulator [Paenibacillus donghaensis]
MEMTDWTSQVRRGIMEFCILLLVSRQPRYGYELVTLLEKWEQLAITEGTLYPLLRRMQKDNYLESFWQGSDYGPPRKYYSLTAAGAVLLETMSSEWSLLSFAVDQIQLYRGEDHL